MTEKQINERINAAQANQVHLLGLLEGLDALLWADLDRDVRGALLCVTTDALKHARWIADELDAITSPEGAGEAEG